MKLNNGKLFAWLAHVLVAHAERMGDGDFHQNGNGHMGSTVAGYKDVLSPSAIESWQTSNSGVSLVHTKVQKSKNELVEGDENGKYVDASEIQSRFVEAKTVHVVLHDANEEVDLEVLFNYSGEEYDLSNVTNNCSSEPEHFPMTCRITGRIHSAPPSADPEKSESAALLHGSVTKAWNGSNSVLEQSSARRRPRKACFGDNCGVQEILKNSRRRDFESIYKNMEGIQGSKTFVWASIAVSKLQVKKPCVRTRVHRSCHFVWWSWWHGPYCPSNKPHVPWTELCCEPCQELLGEFPMPVSVRECRRACGSKGFLPTYPAPCTNLMDPMCAPSGGECWKFMGQIFWEIFNVILSIVPGIGKLASFVGKLGKMGFKAAIKAMVQSAIKVVKEQIKGAFESVVKDKMRGYMADAGILLLLTQAAEISMAEAYAKKLVSDHDKDAASWAESLAVDLAKAADPTGISGLVSAMNAHSGSCDEFAVEPFPCASKECLRLDGVLECEIEGNCPWHPIKEEHRCSNYKKDGDWNRAWLGGVASVFGCNELCRTSVGCDVFSFSKTAGVCLFMAEKDSRGCVAEGGGLGEGFNIYYKFQVHGPPKVFKSAHTCTGAESPANSLSECHQMALSSGGTKFAYDETDTNMMKEVLQEISSLNLLQLPGDPQMEAPSSPGLEADAMSMAQARGKPRASRPSGKAKSGTGSASSINGAGANSVGSGSCTICSKTLQMTSSSDHTVYEVTPGTPDVQPRGVDAGTPLQSGVKCKVATETGNINSAMECNSLCVAAGSCDSFSWSSGSKKCRYATAFGGCEVEADASWATYVAWFDSGSAIRFNKRCSNYKVSGQWVRKGPWSGVKTAADCKQRCVNDGGCTWKGYDRFSWNWKSGACLYIPIRNGCREEPSQDWAIYMI